MPYYHVRLFYYNKEKPPEVKYVDQLNLEEAHLVKEIIEPYSSGKPFRFNSRLFKPSQVADFLIKMTPTRALDIMVDYQGTFIYGTDVTHSYLKRSNKEVTIRKGNDGENLGEKLSIPKEVLEKLPKEIQKTIQGVKLCYQNDHADFCLMGIRKALSTAIHIRFAREGKEQELYDSNEEPYSLAKWIEFAKQNGFLSASIAKQLTKEAKIFGDISAHDYRIDFRKEDVPSIFRLLRLALDRMYYDEENVHKKIGKKLVRYSPPKPRQAFGIEEFDLSRFQTNLKALNGVSDSETRYELLRKIRDQTTDLPYDGMPEDVRNGVIHLLRKLKKERGNEKMRKLCLDILHIINGRRDNKVNTEIKAVFLPWIEKNYQILTIEEKQYSIDILQNLHEHNPKFIEELMLNSIDKWSSEEFDNLYREIGFDRLDKQYVREFKIRLWKLLDETRRGKLEDKRQRIEKLLSLYVFR